MITVISMPSLAWSASVPPTPYVSSSGWAKTHATRRVTRRRPGGPRVAASRQPEQRLEPDREAGPRQDGTRRHQHARDERASVRRVVTDRQGLALAAEDDLLVGDEPGEPDG